MAESKKIVLKNTTHKSKSILKKIGALILSIDIDFIFIFLFLISFLNIPWWYSLLASVGITYWYKKIREDIITITSMRRK